MADQYTSQHWDTPIDTEFEYQPSNDRLSASAGSSASASSSHSPSGYHIVNNVTTSAPNHNPTVTSAADPAFLDFNDTAAWADQNQFTPPLGPNDSDPFDASSVNLFPETWNVPTASFPPQPLQHRNRQDSLPASHPVEFNLFPGGGFPPAPSVDQPGGPPSLPGPVGYTMSTLTPAQQEQLRNIAMPPHLQYQSPKSEMSQLSPQSSNGEGPKGVSPDSSRLGRKRKSSADVDDEDEDDDEDGNHPVKKTAHNMIEKRYRTNLNDKIAALRDSVPSLRVLSKTAKGEDTSGDREELHGLTPAHKLNKATVLSKATEYIRHLEKRNTRLNEENNTMLGRIAAFEKLFMANAMNGNMNPMQQQNAVPFGPDPTQFMAPPGANPRAMDSQGMIPVPEEMKRIINAQIASGRAYPVPQQNPAIMRQQQIQQQQQQQMQNNRWGTGPFYQKMMLGALGGLMFVESLREREQNTESPEGRGLFAIPMELLGPLVSQSHVSIAGHQFSLVDIISSLKSLLFLGTMLWLFVPSLFVPRSAKTPKTQVSNANLKAVPSLASPIHVRRQAWLTAIQTVWVPRHNFFLEAAALVLKMMKLSLRNTIGVHGYQMLTGLTEDQETARVKAWTIALDAQLAGGDVEINKTRLTLTLLASQTLPDTPLRLMLNALHIRVLLWQLGKQGLHNILAAKLARSQWNEARQLNRLINSLRRTTPPSPDDEIPDHLALLLDQDCDDILNDTIVQRAHNLAFNRPTTHDIDRDIDGMNAAVEDPAVRSPMDAVAAWWSSLMLQRVLSVSLAEGVDKEQTAAMAEDINIAVNVAPIGSNAQLRALVAKAVVFDDKRGANIAAVLKALGPSLNPDKHPQYSSVIPPLIDSPSCFIAPDPDVQLALRCAMAIAHLQRYEVPPYSALTIVDTILPGSTEGLSLLGCTAAFQLMERLHNHAIAAEACASALERLSGTLRIWIGSDEGDRPGLDRDIRQKMIERCLNVTKSVIGMDQGYATMTDCESEDGTCELLD